MLTCNVHPSGGTIDWNEFLIVNIDAQTGGVVPVPNNLKEIRMAKLDSAISGCANIEFCTEDYADYRHSSKFPNCLQEAVEKNRVGIVNGQWAMCLDFNPTSGVRPWRKTCVLWIWVSNGASDLVEALGCFSNAGACLSNSASGCPASV